MNEMDVINAYVRELQLATFRENAEPYAQDAVREQWGCLGYLRRLLEEEVTRRREKSKITRIHKAGFPQMKYLEELYRNELPIEGQAMLPILETLDFINEGRSAVMYGNPGTGKTTVAKILGAMMKELGLLSSGHVVVEERSTLMGQNYASEQEKTLSALERAKGGILFIDEAYLLYKPDDPRDPGVNVIETLLTALADSEQQDWMLLIAGYTEPMKRLLEQNAGLKSRIPEQNRFHFDDYTVDELMQIADLFCKQNGYEMSEDARRKVLERVEREYGLRDNKFGTSSR